MFETPESMLLQNWFVCACVSECMWKYNLFNVLNSDSAQHEFYFLFISLSLMMIYNLEILWSFALRKFTRKEKIQNEVEHNKKTLSKMPFPLSLPAERLLLLLLAMVLLLLLLLGFCCYMLLLLMLPHFLFPFCSHRFLNHTQPRMGYNLKCGAINFFKPRKNFLQWLSSSATHFRLSRNISIRTITLLPTFGL